MPRLAKHATDAYLYGWSSSPYPSKVKPIGDPIEVPPPTSVPSNDPDVAEAIAKSAFVIHTRVPSKYQPVEKTDYPPMESFDNVAKDIRDKINQAYGDAFDDPAITRRYKFEQYRKDVLAKLSTVRLKEESQLVSHLKITQLKYGMSMSRALSGEMEEEETIQETIGGEVWEEPRLVGTEVPPAIPPGPEPAGRGGFFVICDGCHKKGTLVPMYDGTLKNIENIVTGDDVVSYDNGHVVNGRVGEVFRYVKNDTISIKTGMGYELNITPNHKIFVVNVDGIFEKPAVDVVIGDCLLVPNKMPEGKDEDITFEQSHFLGGYTGDGNVCHQGHLKNTSMVITDESTEMLEKYREEAEQFGFFGLIRKYCKDEINRRNRLHLNKAEIVRKIREEYPEIFERSKNRSVPLKIMRQKNHLLAGYLRGIFDAEGFLSDHSVDISVSSKKLIRQMQLLLLRFGIKSSVISFSSRERKVRGKTIRGGTLFWRLSINGMDVRRFEEKIGFSHPVKKRKLTGMIEHSEMFVYSHEHIFVPKSTVSEIRWLFRCNSFIGSSYTWSPTWTRKMVYKIQNKLDNLQSSITNGDWKSIRKILYFNMGDLRRDAGISRKKWDNIEAKPEYHKLIIDYGISSVLRIEKLLIDLKNVIYSGCVVLPVVNITIVNEPTEVYDFEVGRYHKNFAGGILGHNSGSMDAMTDTVRNADRFTVASALIWTFIQEAKAVQRTGKSHFMAIYGFDHCMYYPVPCSEFPPHPPINPLPSDNIYMVERDFLRYWPDSMDESTKSSWMNSTEWSHTTPALYDDYVKFGSGDVIIICDGDIGDDMRFMSNDASGMGMGIPKDKENPTMLMKLQKYMVDHDCGSGYVFWIVEHYTTGFECPTCQNPVVDYLGFKNGGALYHYKCGNGHDWWEDSNKPCQKDCACRKCHDCRYLHLVLGKMTNRGKNVFKGKSTSDLLDAAFNTIHDSRMRRIDRGGGDKVPHQDDD